MIALFKDVSIKLLPFFVVLALILALGQPGFASGEFILKAPVHQGQKGEQVRVVVTADNAAGTEGGQFTLKYDPAVAKPVTIEPGSLVTGAASNLHMANLEYARGEMIFMWVTAAADTENNGPLCTIVFDLINDGVANITFDEIVIAPDGVGIGQPISGRITVGDPGAVSNGSENSGAEPADELEDAADQQPEEEITEDLGSEEEQAEERALPGEVSYGVSSYWLPVLIIVVIMAAALVFIIRRNKKSNAKH